MVTFSGRWDGDRVAEFLGGARIPLRLALTRPDGSPWVVALWYRYRDGAFECATWANADVVRFLRRDPSVGFDVSTNDPPYRGVRGNGTASLAPDEGKAVLRSLLERYLGDDDAPLSRQLLDDDREEVRIRIDPERIHSWDYSERMASG